MSAAVSASDFDPVFRLALAIRTAKQQLILAYPDLFWPVTAKRMRAGWKPPDTPKRPGTQKAARVVSHTP